MEKAFSFLGVISTVIKVLTKMLKRAMGEIKMKIYDKEIVLRT